MQTNSQWKRFTSWLTLVFAIVIFDRCCVDFGLAQDQLAYRATQESDRVDFRFNDQLITSYLFQSGSKPVLWPLIGPDKTVFTRHYPIESVHDEERDHIHHRGLWMTYGNVEGLDFWAEGTDKAHVVHRRIVEINNSSDGSTLLTEHDWMLPFVADGNRESTKDSAQPNPILSARCRYTLSGNLDETIIDCEFILKCPDEKRAITFGDTKEGMFAIRIPEAMRAELPAALKGKVKPGQILNANGDVNSEAWGKSSPWVDYTGSAVPESEKIYGVAILIHPQSFHADGCWHVRTYGLFAHNPIGVQDFAPSRSSASALNSNDPILGRAGGYQLPAGASMHLCYRVILHRDRWTADTANAKHKQFAETPLTLAP